MTTLAAHDGIRNSHLASFASWRKLVLVQRCALAMAWDRLFPAHDFGTARLARPSLDEPKSNKAADYWNCETWRRAARAYHEERKRNGHQVSAPGFNTFEEACDWYEAQAARRPRDPQLERLRQLLKDDVSLDRAYNDLSSPRSRPTPATVVEAVVLSVQKHGLEALDHPVNVDLLLRCDKVAKVEINQRIAKLRNCKP
jgi:hypothetical protein